MNKKNNDSEEIKSPTDEEIIIINFLEKLFDRFQRVYRIDDCDLSITPDSIIEQLNDFYPNSGFEKSHLIKLLLDNGFKYTIEPGINTIWLISYK